MLVVVGPTGVRVGERLVVIVPFWCGGGMPPDPLGRGVIVREGRTIVVVLG